MQSLRLVGRRALAAAARAEAGIDSRAAETLGNAGASTSHVRLDTPSHAAIYKRRGRRRTFLRYDAPSEQKHTRPFSTLPAQHLESTRSLTDQHKPSFFHSSRPDFLPSSSAPASADQNGSNSLRAEQNAINTRRYIPPPNIQLIPPEFKKTATSHYTLWNAVAHVSSQDAWHAFVPIFQRRVREDDDITLDARLFDGVFWASTSESSRDLGPQLETFNRARLLYEYANVTNIGLTPLQTRRLVYLFVICWEQHDLCKAPFPLTDFTTTLPEHLDCLDGRLVSRLLSRMATNALFKEANDMTSMWSLGKGKSKERRNEQIIQDNTRSELLVEAVASSSLVDIDDAAWEHMLEALAKERYSPTLDSVAAKRIGLLALRYGSSKVHRAHSTQKFLHKYLSPREIYSLLPDILQKALVGKERPAEEILRKVIGALSDATSEAEDWRNSLVLCIASLLSKRGDTRLAELFLSRDVQNVFPTNWLHLFHELYAECVVLSSRRAIGEANLGRAYHHMELAFRFFSQCDWRKVSIDHHTHQELLRAFARFAWLPLTERRALASDKSMTDLLRQFTSRVLEHDTELDTLHTSTESCIGLLLGQHVALRDYAFTKRIFLINRARFSEVDKLPLNGADFHWLFGAAIDNERTMKFASQLLHYYLWSDMPQQGLSALNHKLLIRYIKRLQATQRGEVLKDLQGLLLGSAMLNVQRRGTAAAIRRLVALIISAQTAEQDFMVEYLCDIFQLCASTLGLSALAGVYSIVLNAISHRRSETTPRTRALLFDSFMDLRERANEETETLHADEKGMSAVREAYTAALQLLTWEPNLRSVKRARMDKSGQDALALAGTLLEELKTNWASASSESLPPALCVVQLEVTLHEGRIDDAVAFFRSRYQPAKEFRGWPATSASKLAIALAAAERYEEASDILAFFHDRQTRIAPLARGEAQLLEIASLSLICMQPDMADLAVQRAIGLFRAGVLPVPAHPTIQHRVLHERHGVMLHFEVRQRLMARRSGLPETDDATKPFLTLERRTKDSDTAIWRRGKLPAMGDWNGQMHKMQRCLATWLIHGISTSNEDAGVDARLDPVRIDGEQGSKDKRETDYRVESAPELPHVSGNEPAAGDKSDGTAASEWDPAEDKRRARAFSMLAAGQHLSATH